MIPLDGPFYDNLSVGEVLPHQPSIVIDEGMAALYQSIVGERLAMTLDPQVSEAVTGTPGRLASPGLVMQLSIGQSTTVSRRAIANLFYRDVRLLQPVFVGDSIATTVTVSALADSRPRSGRKHRGKVLVDIVTTANDEPVVRYQRAPLLPQQGDNQPGHNDDLGQVAAFDLDTYAALVPGHWDLRLLGPPVDWQVGTTITDPARDVISNAVALVRLTHNLALAHRDAALSPYSQRLAYGGHVVGLAQASLSRVLPGMASVVGWHNCDHTGPAFEGDLLSFSHTLLDVMDIAADGAGRIFGVQVEGFAHQDSPQQDGQTELATTSNVNRQGTKILDWTVVAVAP